MTQIARLYGGSMYDLAAEETDHRYCDGADADHPAAFRGESRLCKAAVRAVHSQGGADEASGELHLVRRQNGIL